ncbi:luciferase family protein [Shimia sagamensis]|uniref:Luciferase domain-containing protein n=1 Tax=Shimia sagamensis TaxID=1566352 RepID=A0ABY1PCY4_9RHOB|nr:luciferase family protein [Shimia sagamensis]SMP31499.1 hypothetical protein SAMN06265373_1083 [Shimia sagamensis]
MTFGNIVFVTIVFAALAKTVSAESLILPSRETPIPETTNGVPHVQLGIRPDPDISEKLLERVAQFPGVNTGPTRVSLPGAVGFQLEDGMFLAHPEVIVGGREFAHLHPDGSLHASLDPDLAKKAVQAGWAIAHPWAKQREGWGGFVMIYTPTNVEELDIVMELVAQSYNYVTGRAIIP